MLLLLYSATLLHLRHSQVWIPVRGWLGYVIQRPESHCVHHRLGLHYYNFADFPPIDMLFGTFRNPREFHGECGFDAGGDRRLPAILAFADVNAALYGPASKGAKPAPRASALPTPGA